MDSFLEQHRNKSDVGSYLFKFGKYKTKSFKEVFDVDKSYCAFLYQTLDKQKNRVLMEYIEKRVKEENVV
jgi:hypothetical protein